ncbi:hypothetical protein BDW69DRAFT_198850 [Aspergillus filifer]
MPATVKHFSACADPHSPHRQLLADGVVVIEGAATRSLLDKHDFRSRRQSTTFATELLMNPVFMDLVKRVLTYTTIIYYDQGRTVSVSEPHVSQTSVLYAANDIKVQNEPVRVVAGSNHWTDERDSKEEETLVELMKGDALIWLGSTYYGRAANTTDQTSTLLSDISTPGYRRQEENHYLAVPWNVAEKHPIAVQRFMVYYVSRPYGGAVEHMEPLDYLKVKGDWAKYIPVDLI